MRHLIDCVRLALTHENWHAALAAALMIPDVCASLESGAETNSRHYIAWCDEYLRAAFERLPQWPFTVPGNEIYVLRCSYLHNGSADVSRQRKQDILEHYRFVEPKPGWTFNPLHLRHSQTLQLPVDSFCEAICLAAEQWEQAVLQPRDDVRRRSAELLKVHDPRTDGISLGAAGDSPPAESHDRAPTLQPGPRRRIDLNKDD